MSRRIGRFALEAATAVSLSVFTSSIASFAPDKRIIPATLRYSF